jgi:CRISPR-associated protein Csd1
MILQSLNEYYKRLKEDKNTNVPLRGYSAQKIHFALVIDRQGRLVQVIDLRETQGNRLIPKTLNVPEPVKRTSGIAPNFFWDNTGYVLGADNKDKIERIQKSFAAFKKYHHVLCDELDDEGMKAVLRFLDSWQPKDVLNIKHWDELAGKNLVFQLDGSLEFIHERPVIKKAWAKHLESQKLEDVLPCLVSGKRSPVARLHPDIKGIRGAQAKGAAIVSFNLGAFESYGKKQNYNAPVSKEIAFRYTTALNYLLRPESRQKAQIGNTTTIFWAERETPVEGFMGLILDPREDMGDLTEIRHFLEAVRDGKFLPDIDSNIKFYILGLSPNESRISVRFWHISTVGDISDKIGQHFKDLSIIKTYEDDPEFPGMWHLLREIALQRKTSNIPPVLSGALMRSILTGKAYPQSLLTSIINRIRADQNISYLRAALIKASLVRKFRFKHIPMEVGMILNTENIKIAYRLGRLFAVLEKAQKDAIPSAGATIKDRFYGSASATPRKVFPQLLRLAQHHIHKSEYGYLIDKNIEEIVQDINEFPAHLNLDDQGLFALGYYHQRQAFYTKPDEK